MTRASTLLETLNEDESPISSGLTKDGLKFDLFENYASLEFIKDIVGLYRLHDEIFGSMIFSVRSNGLSYGYKMDAANAEKRLKASTPRVTTLTKIAENITRDISLRDNLAKLGDAGTILDKYVIDKKGTELQLFFRAKYDRRRPDGSVGRADLGAVVIRNSGLTQLEINVGGSYKKVALKELYLTNRSEFASDITEALSK